MHRRLEAVAVLAGVVAVAVLAYVAVEIAAVVLHPGSSVLRASEVQYARTSPHIWLMRGDFLVRSVLGLLFVAALAGASPARRSRLWPGLTFLTAFAIASALLAAFPGPGPTADALVACSFVSLLMGTQFTTIALRLDERWRPVGAGLALLAWAAVVPALLLGEAHLHSSSLGGLYERIFLGLELGWLLVASAWVAAHAMRVDRPVDAL